MLYLLIVNRNPFEWSRGTLKPKLDTREEIVEISPATGEIEKPWPYSRERLELVFAPGEGRLFRIGEEG